MKKITLILISTSIILLQSCTWFLTAPKTPIEMYDAACYFALSNDKEKAFFYLEQSIENGYADYAWAEKDTDLQNLRNEKKWEELIEKMKYKEKYEASFWKNPVWKTSYKENISEDEKIAGLSVFWSEVKYNFAYFDNIPLINWDKLYFDYLPKVKNTKTTFEYYRVLQELCALLKDGHTNVYFPQEIYDLSARPPITTKLVEGKVLLTKVADTLKTMGVEEGFEILKIDNTPVKEYAEKNVLPYQSSSTEQDLMVRGYTYSLLFGNKNIPVILELKDKNGKIIQKEIPRAGYSNVKKTRPLLEYKMLENNIVYVSLNSFEDKNIVPMFDSVFTLLQDSKSLILDVRLNGGGSSNFGYAILAYLTDEKFFGTLWKTRKYLPAFRAWNTGTQWTDGSTGQISPNGKRLYSQPVVVLTSPMTFSAAEDFCVAFDYMQRGKIIGEPTGGSTGQPLFFQLPGGGSARVCTKKDTYPDGKKFVGVGVQPNILVHPTVNDIQTGNDRVLNEAIRYLKEIK